MDIYDVGGVRKREMGIISKGPLREGKNIVFGFSKASGNINAGPFKKATAMFPQHKVPFLKVTRAEGYHTPKLSPSREDLPWRMAQQRPS